ncbi:hypothetical protein [Halomonas elongata]|uniref:hypothetical protein n=1 Tax=Halomonas elongata TaxID=2746 RepID=UPI004034A6D0
MSYRPLQRGTLVFLSGPVSHLHIVMNDPVVNPLTGLPSVLLVNISSIKDGIPYDDACVLTPENCPHAFVRCPSYVYYREACVKAADDITQKVEIGEFQTHGPIPAEAFDLVCSGFYTSKFVTPKVRRFLKHCWPTD